MLTRREFVCAGAAGAALLLPGCSFFEHILHPDRPKPPPAAPGQTPTPNQLVTYLNNNAGQVQSMEVQNLDVEVKKGLILAVGLNGWMVCQKPRNFRMTATMPGMGGTVADLGSNDREFWFWMREANPPDLYYCSHADVGRVQMPFPIQPDWVLEGLGMATITPNDNMRVKMNARDGTIDLIEPSRSPQGQSVYKVTTFNGPHTVSGSQPQVVSRRLLDEKGREICAATIVQMQSDPRTGLLIPREVKFEYPSDRITMRLTLSKVTVNGNVDQSQAERLFTRPTLPNVRSVDLANYREANPTSGGPVRNAVGIFRGAGR